MALKPSYDLAGVYRIIQEAKVNQAKTGETNKNFAQGKTNVIANTITYNFNAASLGNHEVFKAM